MAVSTRRIHHRNIAAAEEEEASRSFFGGYNIGRRPVSAPAPLAHSTAVLEALSNEDSELARFLLIETDGDDEGASNNNGWSSNSNGGGDGGKKRKIMLNTMGYTLALEPLEIRSERIIMLGESFSIFGALFLGGTWILYEWGSDIGVEDRVVDIVSRIFRAVMAAAIICNISLALFGSFLWITSIVHSTTENYVFEARKIIAFCDGLLVCTVEFIKTGMFLALFLNLYPNWPEIVVVMVLAGFIHHHGRRTLGELYFNTFPLEIFHYPYWIKAVYMPSMLKKENRSEEIQALEERARARANYLKAKAYYERKRCGPNNFDSGASAPHDKNTSIGVLLRTAAINLGRSDYDVSAFEAKLEEDWYNEADQLKEEDIDTLSRYMPRLLAKEVHKNLATEKFQCRRSTVH